MFWWIPLLFSMLTIWRPEAASSNIGFFHSFLQAHEAHKAIFMESQVMCFMWSSLLIILCYVLASSCHTLILCLFSGLSYVVRWWWLLCGFFLFLGLLLNLIFVISGPSLCYQSLCCTIAKAKAPRVRYTVFGRGILFFSIILKGSACSHCFASVNSICAEQKARFIFHSIVKYFPHLKQPADTLPIGHTWSLYTIFISWFRVPVVT